MYVIRTASGCIVAALLAISIAVGFKNAAAQPNQAQAGGDGIEVLTHGPVHEAFAQTLSFDPQPGIVIPKTPPAPIEELPPQQRPVGANVAWIPGYWAWDDERTDFLWVSGIWRTLPPGRQWVPGYWAESGSGAQWTSGYWADGNASEIEYLPEPPATVEAGPNVAAPSPDQTWLPGNWIWQQNRYAWQPGYWAAGQANWNWIPSHYVWSPRGYVFVNGYYDYSAARRGVLFAPVYFNSGVYSRPGFSYSPSTAINPAVFGSHLFLRPSYGHYYYGDYYGSNYATAGYSPGFSYNSSRYGYDPFYAQQQWVNRGDTNWSQTYQTNFQNLRTNENLRPPRTWAEQNTRLASGGNVNSQNIAIATPFADLAKSNDHSLRFQAIDQAERQQLAQHSQAVAQHREQRLKLEQQPANTLANAGNTAGDIKSAKLKLPQSPIAAASSDRLGKDHTPPARHEVLKPDLTITPTPRSAAGKSNTIPSEARRLPGTADVQTTKAVPPPEARRQPTGSSAEKSNPNLPAEAKGKAGVESNGFPPGRPNDKAQDRPPARTPGEVKSSPQGKSNVGPEPVPPSKVPGDFKGPPQGKANANPQSSPQGKASTNPPNPPQSKANGNLAGQPQGKVTGNPQGNPQGEAKGKSK
jgi:hypothetical protein